ncbi:exodeoxyribonuclease V subunit gamma [Colwelliaceae bacterium BS250]
MIYIYPANRMEDLLTLFDKVQQTSNLPVLAEEVVLVQNPGMQHWLNMQQAEISGISMNASFVLPAQFLWQQLRLLAGDEVPDQSPYSREVLAWRIDKLLQSEQVIASEECHLATQYWLNNGKADPLKRFQLAVQTADLYEQYLIYRPEWITAWAKQSSIADLSQTASEHQQWQAYIWHLLNLESAYDPLALVTIAKANLAKYQHLLPQRISIFGINALAPMWLDFLSILSSVVDVHFYHLNPCFEYWGDIKTDKALAKQAYLAQVDKWPEDALVNDSANPLLANLGQQGREFLTLLHGAPNIEIPLFDELFKLVDDSNAPAAAKPSVLLQIQKDILTLTDKRHTPSVAVDNSITITSAHSALREVQALHDYLLHLFNDDPSLTPKDVLVMCPQIEQYAPYIDSVFVRGWDDVGSDVPPLPCSIADRISKDSEPLVAAFSELLTMPDSRFGINQIVAYLRLLPLQMRFGLTENDIELICDWLAKANVHWGLDEHHKAAVLGQQNVSSQFTWQQGLDRLLKGFAYGDSTSLFADDLVLPWVEGNNVITLGKLLLLFEQLKYMGNALAKAKTAEAWQQELNDFIDKLFIADDSDVGLTIIKQAIESLALYCKDAKYKGDIELSVVREYLNHHFSQPDPGRQFMIGQITFCSMLPMRAIPFKVLAVLGLNDGEFPRQRQPLGFDLMSMTKPQLGDRSRRGDDRYLFLEALISARQNLYLSYQGNDIKNNNVRQPSIVLRELIDYLSNAYGWHFHQQVLKDNNQLRQMPMQVFSLDNFHQNNQYKSFDGKWFAMANKQKALDSTEPLLMNDDEPLTSLDIVQLNRFLSNPAQQFAQQRLKLFFDKDRQTIDDAEPFSIDHLDKYLFNQASLDTLLDGSVSSQSAQSLYAKAVLSGDFPDNPLFSNELTSWQHTMGSFAGTIKAKIAQQLAVAGGSEFSINDELQSIDIPLGTAGSLTSMQLTANLHIYENDRCIYQFNYRPAKVKAKDLSALYLQHLVACAANTNNKQVCSVGYFINEKDQQVQEVVFKPIDNACQHLQQIIEVYQLGLTKPLLINNSIADKVFWKSSKSGGSYQENDFSQADFIKLWSSGFNIRGLESDPYMHYFWPQSPSFSDLSDCIDTIYQNLYQHLNISVSDLIDRVAMTAHSEQVSIKADHNE